MRGTVGGAVLLGLGATVVVVTLSGEYLNYVRAAHYPWLLAAGAGLVVAGVASLFVGLDRGEPPVPTAARLHTHGPRRASPEELADARRADAPHDHRRIPAVGWLLCVPLFLVLMIPPPVLGAFAAARSDGTVPQPPPSTRFGPLPAGDPVALEVHDYAERAAWDAGRTVAGRTVTLTGFVTPGREGGWALTRAVMTCCALDARSYGIRVVGDPVPRAANTWVEVTGRFVAPADPQAHTAAVTADAVRPVRAPESPYEES